MARKWLALGRRGCLCCNGPLAIAIIIRWMQIAWKNSIVDWWTTYAEFMQTTSTPRSLVRALCDSSRPAGGFEFMQTTSTPKSLVQALCDSSHPAGRFEFMQTTLTLRSLVERCVILLIRRAVSSSCRQRRHRGPLFECCAILLGRLYVNCMSVWKKWGGGQQLFCFVLARSQSRHDTFQDA